MRGACLNESKGADSQNKKRATLSSNCIFGLSLRSAIFNFVLEFGL